MHPRSCLRALHKQNSRAFYHRLNFSTVAPTKNYSSVQCIYNRLFQIQNCLQQCKQIQSRSPSDEMPQTLFQASKTVKILHAQSLIYGVASDGKLGNAIVDLYAKCDNVDFANKAFDLLESRDVLAWNSVMSMYSRCGLLEQVLMILGSLQNSGVSPNEFSYATALSACAKLMNANFGRKVHCGVIKTGFESYSYCEGSLINMYAKCNCFSDARWIFSRAVDPDTVAWTAMIAGYVRIRLPEEALKVFEEMQQLGRVPDRITFVTVICVFVNLGRLNDACHLFSQMPNPDVVAWNAMISGHAQQGHVLKAMHFFQDMRKTCVKPNRSTLASVLSAIANSAYLDYGLSVHAQAVKQGLHSNVYVGSSLLNMYAKCEKIEAAKRVFDTLDERNVVLWNAMLGGYAQNGYVHEVMELFFNMRECGFLPDESTYTSLLKACACLERLEVGCQLHSYILKCKFDTNLFVGNALIDMYAKCGALKEARQQFELMRNWDQVSWNSIIVGYVQDKDEDEAFSMFRKMNSIGITPDEVSLSSILSASANLQAVVKGKQVHCLLVKSGLETNLHAGSSLIDMYAKCAAIGEARKVFSCMPQRSVVSINCLMAGYAQNNLLEAVSLFVEMQAEGLSPSEVTFAHLLDASSGPYGLDFGRQIHCHILKRGLLFDDEFLGVSLLCMYMNYQKKLDANILFSEFPNPKSKVIWTAIISGNAQNGCSEEALHFYREMLCYNAKPDQATFASVLRAVSLLASLRDGREIHSLIFHTGFDSDELTSSALVDMYAKCGDVESSVQVFEEMCSKKDVISWNSMIVGLAKNGYAENALEIFDEMMHAHVKPDDVTFLGVLSACSHAGRVVEGRRIFDIMVNYYGIQPRVDHCACMIDLLGRWGFLKEAEEFIDKLKYESDPMIWATLLGACSIHGDDIRGRWAAEKLIELEPQNSSPYVLLSNIYAASGNWEEVNSVRREMKDKGVKKLPGCSWIEVGQKTNLFVAGDKYHPSAGKIHKILKDLTALMKDTDCFSETDSLLHDVD